MEVGSSFPSARRPAGGRVKRTSALSVPGGLRAERMLVTVPNKEAID